MMFRVNHSVWVAKRKTSNLFEITAKIQTSMQPLIIVFTFHVNIQICASLALANSNGVFGINCLIPFWIWKRCRFSRRQTSEAFFYHHGDTFVCIDVWQLANKTKHSKRKRCFRGICEQLRIRSASGDIWLGQGRCYTSLYCRIPNNSVSGQRRPWSACACAGWSGLLLSAQNLKTLLFMARLKMLLCVPEIDILIMGETGQLNIYVINHLFDNIINIGVFILEFNPLKRQAKL